jgi:hypothetical protein
MGCIVWNLRNSPVSEFREQHGNHNEGHDPTPAVQCSV